MIVNDRPSNDRPTVAWQSRDKLSYLVRGNCLEFLDTLESDSVDCIWTDPPYNLSNGGTTCSSGRRVRVDKGEWDCSQGVESDHEFNKAWLSACYRILKPTGTIWITGTFHVYPSIGFALQQLGYRILNDIVWEKPSPPPNLGCRSFTHSTELILWATKARRGKDRYTFNYQELKAENGGKQVKNVWRISPPSKVEKSHGKHPTQKPVELISKCLRASTNPGDLVLDPFAGSSTTGVAALTLGRRFVGCEFNPDYVELSKRRLSEIEDKGEKP